MKKILTVQAARGLAALMVLGFHAQSVDRSYLSTPLLPSAFGFGQTGLDLFFVVSGFVMAITTKSRQGLLDSASFISHRFIRIYPTYWIYFFALAAAYLAMPGIINRSQGGRVDLVRSFLLLPSDILPILIVAWSLTLELWFYAVFAVMLIAQRKVMSRVLAAWMAIVMALCVLADPPANVWLRVIAHPFAVEFILGALAGLLWLSPIGSGLTRAWGAALSAVGLALVFSTYAAGVIDGSDVISTTSPVRVVLFGAGYGALLLGMATVEREGLRVFKPFVALGDSSYTLYLSHIIVLNVCARVWFSSPLASVGGPKNGVIFWILTFISCVAYALIAYRITEGPLVQFFGSRARGRDGDAARARLLNWTTGSEPPGRGPSTTRGPVSDFSDGRPSTSSLESWQS